MKPLPQNREVFAVSSGNGLSIYKYCYPPSRSTKEIPSKGVPGTLDLICKNAAVAEQPISALVWNADKLGLCGYVAYDQQLRIAVVSNLAQY